MQLELAPREGVGEKTRDGAAALGDAARGLTVEPDGAPALHGLRGGQLRLLDQGLGGEPIGGSEGHADARGEDDLLVAGEVAAGEPVEEQADGGLGLLPSRQAREQGGEEAAAHTRRHRHRGAGGRAQDLLGAEAGDQPLRDLLQDGVGAGAAESAVDDDEVLDVEERHRYLALVGSGHERALQGVLEPVAVGKAGERVEVIAPAPLPALVLDRPPQTLHLAAHAVELSRRLRQLHQALGPHGADVPVERPLQQVGRPRLQGRLRLTLPRAQGKHGDARALEGLTQGLAEAAVALVAQHHVGEDDGGTRAAEHVQGFVDSGSSHHVEAGAGQPARRPLPGRAVRTREERYALPAPDRLHPPRLGGLEHRHCS